MQQSKSQKNSDPLSQQLWYFVFGPSQKSSLVSEFCKQHKFKHLLKPTNVELENNIDTPAIIQSDIQTLLAWEPKKPNISVIFIGNDSHFNEDQLRVRTEYSQIGRCRHIAQTTNYQQFRKSMYPNLIFFYGVAKQHREGAAATIAFQAGYEYISNFPKNANQFIANFSKTKNYIFSNLFTNQGDIQILISRFNLKIVHFKFDRNDYPNQQVFFDEQYKIVKFLNEKTKSASVLPFFFQVDGHQSPVDIMDQIGQFLCPQLIFVNSNNKQQKQYADQYSKDKNTVTLSIFGIQSTNKRKNIPLALNLVQKIRKITSVIFQDLFRQQVVLTDFPWHANQFQTFENVNRKIKLFIDLDPPKQYLFNTHYSSNIHYLQTQRRLSPNLSYPLSKQTQQKPKYYIVVGAQGCGKTSVSKFIQSQYGFTNIEFQPYVLALKQKLISPQDGQQLPIKKIVNHFKDLIVKNNQKTFVIDGVQINQNDFKQWVSAIGPPIVLNLKLDQVNLIKRQRKKAQGDVNAEITQEDNAKAKQLIQRQLVWANSLISFSQQSKIYNVDFSQSLILSQKLFAAIIQPRIFLVQKNPTLIFQNIAIRYNCCFINLEKYSLEAAKNIIRNSRNRDIIIGNYSQTQDKLVSQDLYWIQKNLGKIKYLAIWGGEQIVSNQELMVLQRPVVQKKQKQIVEGQEAQEEKPAQQQPQEGQGQKKKKLDIYAYEWTKPLCYKNLSQWFFKLKKNVQKIQSNPNNVYKHFERILNKINENSNINIYEMLRH